ncbi:MAG: alpha-isopropylmalate synthase regulatory domain-containing protein, partial [Bryobacteraceae bacterium]
VFDDKWHEDQVPFSEAVVVIEGPGGVRTRNSAIGNGPVNALDSALRKALLPYYPNLETMRLVDYKVRVLEGGAGTGARVRVLIESADDKRRWGTVGLSNNVVEASWQALVDSIEYKLHKDNLKPRVKAAASKTSPPAPLPSGKGKSNRALRPRVPPLQKEAGGRG